MGNTNKGPHHRGTHQRRAKHCVELANRTPTHTCPRCGLTLAEGIKRWGKQGRWEAGHVIAGQVNGQLIAEHRHCNRSHGATIGNQQRTNGYNWP